MLQLSASEKLTGQCPNCGWCPPAQNAFRPNIMHEYINSKGTVAVLTESDDQVTTPNGVWLRLKDDNGRLIKRDSIIPPKAPIGNTVPQTASQVAATQTIVPSREIPASLIKTPEEVAATPKPVLAPVVLPTPVASNPAAPAQTNIDPKQP